MTGVDADFISLATAENIADEFRKYKVIKTDLMGDEPEVNVQMGVDGVSAKAFERQLVRNARNIARRLSSGKYQFSPFREVLVAKEKGMPLERAKRLGKTRTLSIACIRDVVVQRLLLQTIAPVLEGVFSETPALDRVSFAYRIGKSAPAAARLTYSYVLRGYTHVLDGDIRKFFDEIPHERLITLLENTFGSDTLVASLLRRFVKSDRTPWESYEDVKGTVFYKRRPQRVRRTVGIPQGGVLSGPIANLYLHALDKWVVEELDKKHDIKYVRYADDFIILAKDPDILPAIRDLTRDKLDELGLFLHTDPSKTRQLDLSREWLEFVGFSISPRGIRVKPSNLRRFRERFRKKLREPYKGRRRLTPQEMLAHVLQKKLQFKILGNYAEGAPRCPGCGRIMVMRSWMAFFATVTDVRQLRALDTWIRKAISDHFYAKYATRVTAHDMRDCGLERLERVYYAIRRSLGSADFCECEVWRSKEAELAARLRRLELLDLLSEHAS